MMREILFRGKRVCNGDWLFGGFHSRFGRAFIIGCSKSFWFDGMDVIPETVGQYTGLTDKNGKRVFEGDIIQYSIEEDQAVFIGAVKFGEFNPDGGALLNTNVGFYAELVDQEGKRTYMRKDIGFWVKFRGVEVIGNIHDNPELLEGGD